MKKHIEIKVEGEIYFDKFPKFYFAVNKYKLTLNYKNKLKSNDEENNNKKIFFSNKITTPKEFKTKEFWIEFIEKEIENNRNNTDSKEEEENKNKQNDALMEFIGNISNLNDYLSNQSKIKEVFAFFAEKYSFNEDNIKNVSDILGFNVK